MPEHVANQCCTSIPFLNFSDYVKEQLWAWALALWVSGLPVPQKIRVTQLWGQNNFLRAGSKTKPKKLKYPFGKRSKGTDETKSERVVQLLLKGTVQRTHTIVVGHTRNTRLYSLTRIWLREYARILSCASEISRMLLPEVVPDMYLKNTLLVAFTFEICLWTEK